MSSYIQSDFSGGINLFDDSSKLKDNEYYLLINGRSRNIHIEPVKLPLLIDELPDGKIQGIYTAAPFLIAFVAGKAYVKDYLNNTPFLVVNNLQLSSTVDRIYLVLLPASTVNFRRSRTEESINGNEIEPKVDLTTGINGSPQCALVQDGVNQPWIIFADGSSRVTRNYDQWTLNDSEYVPIGSLMLFHNSILYLISKDLVGKYTIINRSVSGRPLDFMVNIREDGNKPDLSEALGGAQTTSHKVSYDEITCLSNINSPDGSFYIGTLNNSYYVKPNTTRLIFGEPTFDTLPLFNTGPLNNFSIVNVLGDTVFTDTEGVKSFNSVIQTQNESKLNPFSLKVDKLFEGLVQDIVASVSFDLYAFFAVSTIYGYGILVYDTTRQVFVSLDIYPLVGQIKQFTSLRYRGIRKLFFFTTENELYEVFASTETSTCKFITKEYVVENPSFQQFTSKARLIFNNTREEGEVTFYTYADRFHKRPQTQLLDVNVDFGLLGNKVIPYGQNIVNEQKVQFDIYDKVLGSRLSHQIIFNCLTELTYISTTAEISETL